MGRASATWPIPFEMTEEPIFQASSHQHLTIYDLLKKVYGMSRAYHPDERRYRRLACLASSALAPRDFPLYIGASLFISSNQVLLLQHILFHIRIERRPDASILKCSPCRTMTTPLTALYNFVLEQLLSILNWAVGYLWLTFLFRTPLRFDLAVRLYTISCSIKFVHC